MAKNNNNENSDNDNSNNNNTGNSENQIPSTTQSERSTIEKGEKDKGNLKK